jgi:hypothetical protein
MHLKRIASAAVVVLALASILAGCSVGPSDRQLVSISISPTAAAGAPVTYTATGTFSDSPVNVTPVAVSWFIMGPAIDPPGPGYALAPGKYTSMHCSQGTPFTATYTIVAVAPSNPKAPNSGAMDSQVFSDLVIQHTKTMEAGFVAGTAKLKCS